MVPAPLMPSSCQTRGAPMATSPGVTKPLSAGEPSTTLTSTGLISSGMMSGSMRSTSSRRAISRILAGVAVRTMPLMIQWGTKPAISPAALSAVSAATRSRWELVAASCRDWTTTRWRSLRAMPCRTMLLSRPTTSGCPFRTTRHLISS